MPKLKNSDLIPTYHELVKVQREIKDLEERKNLLKFTLVNSIPAGKSKGGISHVVKPHTSVSWKKISDIWLLEYIPKRKLSEAQAVIVGNTNTTSSSSFKEDKK